MNVADPFRNPLCVALDVSDASQARALAQRLADCVGGFKLGPRLLLKEPGLIKELSQKAPVFVDCKYFDIPSTMLSAVQSCFDEGASAVTVHALSGAEALRQVSELEAKLNQIRPFRVFAVTILTSWTQASYPPILKPASPAEHVASLARLALDSGIKGLVCSVEELSLLDIKSHYLVTPGIRREGDSVGDQSRVATPERAIAAGANLLVVGRPIIAASDPLLESHQFLKSISQH